MDNIKEALNYIDVSTLDYHEWIAVGMALKAEGYDCSLWESWSSKDSRYKQGECERKWNTFNGSTHPVGGGSIIQLAKDKGWNPYAERQCEIPWDGVIEYDGDGMIYEHTNTLSGCEQLITYLETLFKEDEFVSYVSNDVWKDADGRYMPSKGVYDRTAKELIEQLKKHPDDIGAVIGDWKEECGAWVRFNPVDGKGIKNANITRFTYALVESDNMPIAEQDALYRKFELPIAALVHSGGKSLHAIVKVDANDEEDYRKRVDYLYDFLEKNGLPVDKANRNPSRLSRMPGVTRNGNMQTLVATNIGRRNWNEWLDFAEGIVDELPALTYLDEALTNPPALPEQLIEGILRVGHKMLISGSSKAGKSFLLMELCVSLAEGIKWLGFQCKKSKVLYVNLEIDGPSCINRFNEIYRAFNIEPKNAHDIVIWNLRGKAMPLDKLVPRIVRKISKQGFDAVIIDPIYKVIMGDENNASEMGAFCNQFDKICNETGCSAIYCHHHSKGSQGAKKAKDRASGSGVFSRDPDAQLDMIQLETTEEFMQTNADDLNSTAWRLESSLREFPNIKPVNFWFKYPIHVLDDTNVLNSTHAEGDPRANLTRSGKRNQSQDARREEFDKAFSFLCMDEDGVSAEDLAEYLDISPRTIRSRVCEFRDEYETKGGIVSRRKVSGRKENDNDAS